MELAHVLARLGAGDSAPAPPRQQRLYALLKAAILDGTLAPGQALPGSRQLAADYGIARNTVLHAYQLLQAEGFVTADRGGTRVAALPLAAVRPPGAPLCQGESPGLSRRAGRLQLRRGEAILPFAPGVGDLNAFPWATWARHLQRAWGEVSARQLAYAPPGGEPALRAALAGYLRARRGVVCEPAQVFVVGGAQVALDACARLLADPGDIAWVENPCYPAARTAMQTAGLQLVHVPVDGEGMAPEAALWQQHPPRLLYLTPSHQYPLGSVLSLERRLDFLGRIEASRGWIIEDDYDSEFGHGRPGGLPPAIQGLRAEAPVVYVGTFSKLLYPGLRLAYLVVPRWLAGSFGDRLDSLYRSGQAVEQRALAGFLDSGGLTRHQRTMAPIYRARQAVLRRELAAAFGPPASILGGAAGLHLTLLLPDGPADVEIVRQAAGLGVTARPLSEYRADGAGAPLNGLVLGYGMADEQRIPELVARLAAARQQVLDALHHAPPQ